MQNFILELLKTLLPILLPIIQDALAAKTKARAMGTALTTEEVLATFAANPQKYLR